MIKKIGLIRSNIHMKNLEYMPKTIAILVRGFVSEGVLESFKLDRLKCCADRG